MSDNNSGYAGNKGLIFGLVAIWLLTVSLGCSGGQGTVSESGVYNPSPGQVVGELKPGGENEFLAGNYREARPLLTNAARGGSLRAIYYLRIIVDRGLDGQAPNPDEANKLLSLMAAMQDRLKELAESGPKDDRGIYQASMAILYFRGFLDGGQNLGLALELARQSASSGFAPAVNLAAAILLTPGTEAGKIKDLFGMGLSEAFSMSLAQAQKNDPIAMGNVGYMYRAGQGTGQDHFQGAIWARKAASIPQTTPRVLNDLGAIYEEAKAVTKDMAEAKRWYGLAAARGYPAASRNLSRLRTNKGGIPETLTGLEY
ncbi:MAG: sel1 repeat family protein [Deltaproteobacteria bacterium]|jgi:TPR repeat protein|nr:sel1 repeat family protein [Deltaproteobacteria bacterium]